MKSAKAALWCGVLFTAGMVMTGCESAPHPSAPRDPAPATAKVVRKDLDRLQLKFGTVGYGTEWDLPTDLAGTITGLPDTATTVPNGGVLYRIDTVPVVRLDGTLPAWRALGPGVADGGDVRQLEAALRALGYGKNVRIDDHWTYATTAAVKAWQKALGITPDGTVQLGQVVFTPHDLRIQGVPVQLGDRVQSGTPILKVTDTQRQVTVVLDPSSRDLAPVGGEVTLNFDDGTTAAGKITAVLDQPADAQGGKATLRVTIALPKGPAIDKQLAGSTVQAAFHKLLAKDALTVPVTALVGLADGGYGVQKVASDGSESYVPVEPGAFSDTDVAITGNGIEAGDKVVVAP